MPAARRWRPCELVGPVPAVRRRSGRSRGPPGTLATVDGRRLGRSSAGGEHPGVQLAVAPPLETSGRWLVNPRVASPAGVHRGQSRGRWLLRVGSCGLVTQIVVRSCSLGLSRTCCSAAEPAPNHSDFSCSGHFQLQWPSSHVQQGGQLSASSLKDMAQTPSLDLPDPAAWARSAFVLGTVTRLTRTPTAAPRNVSKTGSMV